VKNLPSPETVTPTTPLRLDVAARLAFPDGSIKASALRRMAASGKLDHEKIAGKLYTTLANIEEMRCSCRVHAKAPDFGSGPVETTERRSGLSSTEERKLALASAKATLQVQSKLSPDMSPESTTQKKPRAQVIRMRSK